MPLVAILERRQALANPVQLLGAENLEGLVPLMPLVTILERRQVVDNTRQLDLDVGQVGVIPPLPAVILNGLVDDGLALCGALIELHGGSFLN